MERCQTPFISSVIAVFCYMINTAFTPSPIFGSQYQHVKQPRSGPVYWEFFANKAEER